MTRTELRGFLNAGVSAINPQMPFDSGRLTEWNSNRSNEYPGTWWESIVDDSADLINHTLPNTEWPVRLHIGKLDKMDSSNVQYEQIIDECHYIAQQLVHQYSQIMSSYSSISMTGINRSPFVKKHADCVTGVILSFTLVDPDKTNLC